jgi:hypothetical protein
VIGREGESKSEKEKRVKWQIEKENEEDGRRWKLHGRGKSNEKMRKRRMMKCMGERERDLQNKKVL